MSRYLPRGRRGFTLYQLLVILAILAILLGFLLPFIARARRDAGRAQSENNLKQLALATINCADTYNGKLPPAPENWFPVPRQAPNNGYGPCLFHILPYLEQDNLYKAALKNVGDTPVYGSWNAAGKAVKTYTGPGDPTAEPAPDRTNYLGNELAMPAAGARYPASFTDGTSQSILFAECYARAADAVTWGGREQTWKTDRRWWDNPTWKPTPGAPAFQVAPAEEAASATLPQGLSPTGITVALADGTAKLVSARTSATTFHRACNPRDGETLGDDW